MSFIKKLLIFLFSLTLAREFLMNACKKIDKPELLEFFHCIKRFIKSKFNSVENHLFIIQVFFVVLATLLRNKPSFLR